MIKISKLNIVSKIWTWANKNPIKTIIITGLLIRLLVSLLYQHITLYPDSLDYISLAERLSNLNLNGYGGERSPGYPLLICLTGFSDILMVITQSLIGICTLIIIYKTIIATGIKENTSLLITLLLSCYLPTVFFEVTLLTETVTLFVISLIFFLFFKLAKDKEYPFSTFLWLALFCGYLILIKPFYIFLPFLLTTILLCQKKTIKIIWKKCTIFFLISSFAFLGWSYVNKVNTGYFVSSTYYGFNLAQNCVSFAEKTTPEYKEIGEIYAKYRDNRVSDKEIAMTIWDAYPKLTEKTGLSLPDLSKRLYDYSIVTIKMNPVAYIKQVFVSWCDFWKTSLYWNPNNFGVPQASQIILYICYVERILFQLVKILFVLLIPFNIIFCIRKRKITRQLTISLVVLTASILQAFATYGTNSRYSFPFEMLIIISVALNYVQYLAYKRKTA